MGGEGHGKGHGECHGAPKMRERHHGGAGIMKKSFESMSGHRFNFGRRIQHLQYCNDCQIVQKSSTVISSFG